MVNLSKFKWWEIIKMLILIIIVFACANLWLESRFEIAELRKEVAYVKNKLPADFHDGDKTISWFDAVENTLKALITQPKQ